MQTALPLIRDIVFVGGGHTHALVLLRFGMRPVPGVRLTVVDPEPVAAYSGMLPGFVAGHYPREALEIDLVRLARFAGARLIRGAVEQIDPEARQVRVPGRGPVAYDIASIDIGVTARMPLLPGFSEYGVPAKPLAGFAAHWQEFCQSARSLGRLPRVAVIGAGLAGVELAMTMAWRLRQIAGAAEVTVFDRGTPLDRLPERARARLLVRAAEQGVVLMGDTDIEAVTSEGPVLSGGIAHPADLTVGAAGASPARWLGTSGLATEQGFISVGPTLQSLSHGDVFAAGDCAHLSHAPRPKAGVYAVRAAPVLDANLRALLAERPLRPYHPQRDYLKLVSLGPKVALATKGRLALDMPLMWRWKDRIDRKFMAMLQDLPAMPAPAVPREAPAVLRRTLDGAPMCGGCGSKVGPGALAEGLCAAGAETGDDAAILPMGDRRQVISTDHLRAVTEDPPLMAQIALNHAMGDVWAMGAAPQVALAQITLPRMAEPLQVRTLAEITGATRRLAAIIGVQLAGGHTTMGAEMVLGFTVTGLCDRPPLTKGGMCPGDVLILTRGIGSGTLLAAEMQGRAHGRDVTALWSLLASPQHRAAGILAPVATAMTDVTGFGLAGHMLEMARASGCGVEIDLGAVPFLPGARDLAHDGIRSTIWPANRDAALPHISGWRDGPETALLLDPQTCGGLLAAVPENRADAVLAALTDATRIGRVVDAAPGLTIL